MATLNKTLGSALDATAPHEFDVLNTKHFKYYTVEAEYTGLLYPAAENDAELSIHDGEIDDENGTVVPEFESVNGGLVKVADASTRSKIRIVDLMTKNVKVKYVPNSVSGGTIDSLTITFST
jgi:hypothetical protein